MIRDWKAAMTPYYDGLEEFCEDRPHECESMTTSINAAKKIDVAYVKNILANRKMGHDRSFYYNSCEDTGADCGDLFDTATRTYITDPKLKQAHFEKMDKARQDYALSESAEAKKLHDDNKAAREKHEKEMAEKEAEKKA